MYIILRQFNNARTQCYPWECQRIPSAELQQPISCEWPVFKSMFHHRVQRLKASVCAFVCPYPPPPPLPFTGEAAGKSAAEEGEGTTLGDALSNKTTQQILLTGAVLSFTVSTFMMGRQEEHEVSFQEFKTKLLEKGLVDHIEVTNKTKAKVYVRPANNSGFANDAPASPGVYKFYFNIGR